MRILITGANGQLGHELVRQGQALNFTVQGTAHDQMDITDGDRVSQTLQATRPALVINAAAYTHVDKAEAERERAFAVNQAGPANLAGSCAELEIPLIHISTDYVFDGRKGSPYREADPISPLGIYGQSKAAGEAAIRQSLKPHIILRTSWLYGVHGHNFVKTILRLAREKKVLRVVADQYGCPTSAADLAETVMQIALQVRNGAAVTWGTYHYCGLGITTWHGFATEILDTAAARISLRTRQIEPIETSDYPTPARRPAFSALDCGRIQKCFGIERKPWPDSLKTTIARLLSDQTSAF
ncbi:MAG: dTDP-4-dehydrorhamnose reductase [Desulfobacterales bacterium]|nr:MAG: dTDP-4-dehydrorhamnose reductase [Desulfobacterales bacterium]